jgi:Homeodomain-like domain
MPAKQYHVRLDEEQRTRLEQVAHSNKRSQRERTRARILLLADAAQEGGGCKDEVICRQVRTSASTVVRVRQRFAQGSSGNRSDSGNRSGKMEAALWHKPQEKRKARKLDGAGEAHLIALVCSAPPEGHKQWSLHLLKDKLIEMRVVDAISHEAVRTTLKKMNLSRG